MKKIKIIFVLMIFAIINIYAQDLPDSESDSMWFMGKAIADITFEGLKTIKKEDISDVVKSYIGKIFDAELIRSLQDRLNSIDYFDEITPYADKFEGKTDKVVIKIHVVEKAKIGLISIYGNSRIRDSVILEVLRIKTNSFFSEIKIKLDIENIQKLYLDKGYFDTQISYTVVDSKDETGNPVKNIEYNIKESGQTIVNSIEIIGNENLKSNKILGSIETKKKSTINSGTFKGKENFELDKQKILELYSKSGYIDAQVIDIQIEKDTVIGKKGLDGNNYIKIKYFIKENDAWRFNGVNFTGNKVFDEKQFKPYINHKKGDVINMEKINKMLSQVQQEYANNGYIFTYISLSDKRDDKRKTVEYTINIQEQGKGYIGDIIIRGNKKTKTNVIQRELEISEGQMYDMSKLQKTVENLYATQYFGNILPKPVLGKGNRVVDIIIDVEEKKTISSGIGGSFGGDPRFPLSAFINWTDVNLAGRGYIIDAKLNLSWYQQQLGIQFINPWIFNVPIALGFDVGYTHKKGYNMSQDMSNPIFPKESLNAVPDPYKGYYVFQKDTKYNGKSYKAGDMFPGVPKNIDEINKYGLLTDYSYNGGSYTLAEEDTMQYDEHSISFGTSLKYTLKLPFVKRFSPFIGQRFSFDYLTYNADLYRPYSVSVLNTNSKWAFKPQTYFGFDFDSRDIPSSPSKGFLISQQFTLTYGKLTTYFQTDSQIQLFFTLWDVKVSDSWSSKMVLALNSQLSLLLPLGSKNGNPNFLPNNDYLATNGISVARGWGYNEGEVLWNNWVELRMPLVEKVFWFDMYFEAVSLTSKYSDFLNSQYWQERFYNDWLFSFGAGFRFTIPSFPIRIYIAKLFRIDEAGKPIWQRGNIFYSKNNDKSGVTLIFSIGFI